MHVLLSSHEMAALFSGGWRKPSPNSARIETLYNRQGKKNKSKKNRKNKKAIEDLFDVVALGRFPLGVVRERVGEPGHLYSCPHDGPSHVCGCLA